MSLGPFIPLLVQPLAVLLSLSLTHTHTQIRTSVHMHTRAIIGQLPPPVLGIVTETKSSEHEWLGLASTIIQDKTLVILQMVGFLNRLDFNTLFSKKEK